MSAGDVTDEATDRFLGEDLVGEVIIVKLRFRLPPLFNFT